MTPPDDAAGPGDEGLRDLEVATAQLRAQPPTLPVEVADRAFQRALATPRPTGYVRAAAPHDFLTVSTVALTEMLRRALDEGLPHAATMRVRCLTSRHHELEQLTVELVVQYGHDIRESAARARTLIDAVLVETLGDVRSPAVLLHHVHVSDVTVADPHLVDPSDEQPGGPRPRGTS